MIKKLITALAAIIITTSSALAVDYSGKTVTIWIPFKAGGGSDTWARAIGPAFSKNLPGNPTVVVKNVTDGKAIGASNKYQYIHEKYPGGHQVEKYVDFVNDCLNTKSVAGNLSCYLTKSKNKKSSRILGINPGASYGSAKRWYPDQFAKIAIELSSNFDILIFGGVNELEFAKEIESNLVKNNISNYLNLAGKTTISELTNYISNLDVFITADSGPMHIAASLDIPTIALFGPTDPIETSQWKNSHSVMIKKELECQPCMKRTCPLKHHNCMKLIDAREVIDSISRVSQR